MGTVSYQVKKIGMLLEQSLAIPPSVRIVVTPIENTNDKMGTDRETNFTRT